MPMSQSAAGGPVSHVTESRTENKVNTAKPRLKMRTRPNMSPTRPRETTSTARTTMKPISIHSMYPVLPGASGLSSIPRKMSGREISTMDWLMNTIRVPSVTVARAIHL